MKKVFIAAVALGLAMATSGYAKKAAPSSSSESTGLAGKIGVGFDSIAGANTGGAVTPGFSTPNALAVRYWTSDAMGIEALLALNSGSQTTGPSTTSSTIFGLGAGLHYNWKKPSEYFLVQWIGRVSFASAASTIGSATNTTATIALFGGTGFEAFIPAWPALSVEGNVGLGLSTQSSSSSLGGPANTSSSFGVNGNGFTPISVAVHYYFD